MDRSIADPPFGFPMMKPSTVEDCLEALHALRASDDFRPIVEVARWLGMRLELAVAMLEILGGEGLVECSARVRVRLTRRGRQETVRVVRRRRLVEAVLIARHGCMRPAAQIIAARVAYTVPGEIVEAAALAFGEPDLTPHAEPAPAWATAMRAHSAQALRPSRLPS